MFEILLDELEQKMAGMNGFIEQTRQYVVQMNGAVDELDRQLGALRNQQRVANQLLGAAESNTAAMNDTVERLRSIIQDDK